MKIEFIIPVQPRTKKNSGQIVMRGKYPILLPSKQYQQFEKDCLPYLQEVWRKTGVIDYPVNVQAHYYRDSKRRVDIANLHSALHDVLVKSGLVLDDNRDIIASTDGSRVFYDKYKPRIEVVITEITDYVQWNDTKNKQITLLERK